MGSVAWLLELLLLWTMEPQTNFCVSQLPLLTGASRPFPLCQRETIARGFWSPRKRCALWAAVHTPPFPVHHSVTPTPGGTWSWGQGPQATRATTRRMRISWGVPCPHHRRMPDTFCAPRSVLSLANHATPLFFFAEVSPVLIPIRNDIRFSRRISSQGFEI